MTKIEEEKRDHDLLIEINTKLSLFFSKFNEHIDQDKEDFDRINKQIKFFEKIVYMGIGIILFTQFIIKFMN